MPKNKNNFKQRKINKDLEVFESLDKIYSDQSGKTDFAELDRDDKKSGHPFFIWTVFLFLVLCGILLIGYLTLGGNGNKFSGVGIEINIISEGEVISGEEIEYIIEYTNKENVDISQAKLFLHYPDGFYFKDSSIQRKERQQNNELEYSQDDSWDLGYLVSQETKQISITGQIVGEVDSKKTLTATIMYQPSNFNAQFSSAISYEVTIDSSVVELSIESANRLSPDDKIDYVIKFQNNSKDDLSNVNLRLSYPSGFEYQNSEPEPREENNVWSFKNFVSGEEKKIIVSGKLSGDAGNSQELKAQLGLLSDEDLFKVQAETHFVTLLVSSRLVLDVEIAEYADWGDDLSGKIMYRNEGELVIENLILMLEIDGQIIDWKTMRELNDGKVEEGKITWSGEGYDDLEKIKVGGSGEVDFLVQIQDAQPYLGGPWQIVSTVKASGKEILETSDDEVQKINFQTNSVALETKINTEVEFIASGRYFDEYYKAIGSGPLPPKVDQKTTYVVFWEIAGNVNELKNLTATASLPKDVTWEGMHDIKSGDIKYDADSRVVTWDISRLPKGAGVTFSAPQTSFQVSINPTDNDVNKVLVLLPNATLIASDVYSKGEVIIQSDVVTTNLIDDNGASGKAVVQP